MGNKKYISGIYSIYCKINDKFYIGSSKNIKYRFNQHKLRLKKDIHTNKHLQNAWNKYGKHNFIFEIIEFCAIDVLLEREQLWIDRSLCYDKTIGFNKNKKTDSTMVMFGDDNYMYGKTWEDVHGEKYSAVLKKNMGDRMRKIHTGKKYSDKHRKNISNSKLGAKNPHSKLNTNKVMIIKIMIMFALFNQKQIADFFSVSKSTICDINKGRLWVHVEI